MQLCHPRTGLWHINLSLITLSRGSVPRTPVSAIHGKSYQRRHHTLGHCPDGPSRDPFRCVHVLRVHGHFIPGHAVCYYSTVCISTPCPWSSYYLHTYIPVPSRNVSSLSSILRGFDMSPWIVGGLGGIRRREGHTAYVG
jgi:hypothetical protein